MATPGPSPPQPPRWLLLCPEPAQLRDPQEGSLGQGVCDCHVADTVTGRTSSCSEFLGTEA